MELQEIKTIDSNDVIDSERVHLSEGLHYVLSVSKGLGIQRHDAVHAGLCIFSVTRVINYAFHDALVCEFKGVCND